ncbi:hypothetical protein DGG96_18110 [Legionella qingyii]|uniref:Uncharacterized protein n=1 Tax=Legionella qingyii TaxID=2184757 RepID=A0A317U1I9_9GAMM|nr:hypothetical protein [Legionella qingyii]PWY54240.1 hypothetical protein DGG96_18110 [Legionella qingyii]
MEGISKGIFTKRTGTVKQSIKTNEIDFFKLQLVVVILGKRNVSDENDVGIARQVMFHKHGSDYDLVSSMDLLRGIVKDDVKDELDVKVVLVVILDDVGNFSVVGEVEP